MQSQRSWLRSAHAQESEQRSRREHRHVYTKDKQRADAEGNRRRQISMTLLCPIEDTQQRVATERHRAPPSATRDPAENSTTISEAQTCASRAIPALCRAISAS